MNNGRKKSIFPYIPGYDNNTVLKLIFFLSGAYIMLAIIWAIVMLVYSVPGNFDDYFLPNIGLPHLANFGSHWWTFFTHGIFQFPNSFMELLSNMLWLYAFGSVLQMLVGRKQIIPIFFYGLFAGGLFYLLAQMLPGELGKCPPLMMGPRAGLVAICAAAVTISPQYRFYLTETFRVHIMVVAGIFGVLMLMGSGFYLPVVAMLVGGGLLGFGYIKLLQAGYRPGQWMYSLAGSVENLVTPDEENLNRKKANKRGAVLINFKNPQSNFSENRIDELLDKINQKGFNALSKEEKDFLSQAGKK
jgi:membrane associated rhomboid family serine protease